MVKELYFSHGDLPRNVSEWFFSLLHQRFESVDLQISVQ